MPTSTKLQFTTQNLRDAPGLSDTAASSERRLCIEDLADGTLMTTDDAQVFRRDDALMLARFLKPLFQLVERTFADAPRIPLERLEGGNHYGFLGPLNH